MRATSIVVFTLAAALVGARSAQEPAFVLRGRVADAAGRPVSRATVASGTSQTVTDVAGEYRLLVSGESGELVRLVAMELGYRPDTVRTVLTPGDSLGHDLVLRPDTTVGDPCRGGPTVRRKAHWWWRSKVVGRVCL